MIARLLSALSAALCLLLAACASPPLRGTGDLGVVIERARGSVQIVEQSARRSLGRVDGLGDLSHASVVFSRDGRYAYVFGRDGGLSQVDVLSQRLVKRVMQAGNSIGGAISSAPTRWRCWPKSAPAARKWSAWPTCPAIALPSACLKPAKSG